MRKNDTYEAEIIDVTHDGSGITRINGFVVFVNSVAIGDVVNIKIIKVKKNYAIARLENILHSSPYRIDIDCEYFGKCGGCSFRHISYEKEMEIKKSIVENAFKKIAGFNLEIDKIFPNYNILKYRNKAQYPIGMDKGNNAIAGFYRKNSHSIINVDSCILHPDIFSDIIGDIRLFIASNNISVYDESSGIGTLRHVYIRTNKNGDIMVCLVINGDTLQDVDTLISKMIKKYDKIVSVILNINKSITNVVLGDVFKTVYGTGYLEDTLLGLQFKISPSSFYQVNSTQMEVLYNLAYQMAGLSKNDVLLDLFCGIGTIGLCAASSVRRVIGIDIVEDAIKNAEESASVNNITNAEFHCLDAIDFVKVFDSIDASSVVAIIDPPRKGCDKLIIENISKCNIDRVVMISCNPSTAARDCMHFIDEGYKILDVGIVDMFSRTHHVECVVLMSKVEE